jgi:hypothetical protein
MSSAVVPAIFTLLIKKGLITEPAFTFLNKIVWLSSVKTETSPAFPIYSCLTEIEKLTVLLGVTASNVLEGHVGYILINIIKQHYLDYQNLYLYLIRFYLYLLLLFSYHHQLLRYCQ